MYDLYLNGEFSQCYGLRNFEKVRLFSISIYKIEIVCMMRSVILELDLIWADLNAKPFQALP